MRTWCKRIEFGSEEARKIVDDCVGSENINFLGQMIHRLNNHLGWWHDIETGEPKDRNVGELICLMHSELSEAMEADRKDLMDDKLPHRKGLEVELADLMIRVLDVAGAGGMDIGGAMVEKLKYNLDRPDHKPENRIKEGGKKY